MTEEVIEGFGWEDSIWSPGWFCCCGCLFCLPSGLCELLTVRTLQYCQSRYMQNSPILLQWTNTAYFISECEAGIKNSIGQRITCPRSNALSPCIIKKNEKATFTLTHAITRHVLPCLVLSCETDGLLWNFGGLLQLQFNFPEVKIEMSGIEISTQWLKEKKIFF